MCLNETYNRVWVGKHPSDMFPIRNGLKQGDALSPSLFNIDDVNILDGSVHTIKKKHAEALLVRSKEIGLEVNADRTRYVVVSRDQNAEQGTI